MASESAVTQPDFESLFARLRSPILRETDQIAELPRAVQAIQSYVASLASGSSVAPKATESLMPPDSGLVSSVSGREAALSIKERLEFLRRLLSHPRSSLYARLWKTYTNFVAEHEAEIPRDWTLSGEHDAYYVCSSDTPLPLPLHHATITAYQEALCRLPVSWTLANALLTYLKRPFKPDWTDLPYAFLPLFQRLHEYLLYRVGAHPDSLPLWLSAIQLSLHATTLPPSPTPTTLEPLSLLRAAIAAPLNCDVAATFGPLVDDARLAAVVAVDNTGAALQELQKAFNAGPRPDTAEREEFWQQLRQLYMNAHGVFSEAWLSELANLFAAEAERLEKQSSAAALPPPSVVVDEAVFVLRKGMKKLSKFGESPFYALRLCERLLKRLVAVASVTTSAGYAPYYRALTELRSFLSDMASQEHKFTESPATWLLLAKVEEKMHSGSCHGYVVRAKSEALRAALALLRDASENKVRKFQEFPDVDIVRAIAHLELRIAPTNLLAPAAAFDTAIAKYTAKAAESATDAGMVALCREGIERLFSEYALFQRKIRQFKQAVLVYERAVNTELVKPSARLWREYAEFAISRNKKANARNIFLRAIKAVSSNEVDNIWDDFLKFERQALSRPTLTHAELKELVADRDRKTANQPAAAPPSPPVEPAAVLTSAAAPPVNTLPGLTVSPSATALPITSMSAVDNNPPTPPLPSPPAPLESPADVAIALPAAAEPDGGTPIGSPQPPEVSPPTPPPPPIEIELGEADMVIDTSPQTAAPPPVAVTATDTASTATPVAESTQPTEREVATLLAEYHRPSATAATASKPPQATSDTADRKRPREPESPPRDGGPPAKRMRVSEPPPMPRGPANRYDRASFRGKDIGRPPQHDEGFRLDPSVLSGLLPAAGAVSTTPTGLDSARLYELEQQQRQLLQSKRSPAASGVSPTSTPMSAAQAVSRVPREQLMAVLSSSTVHAVAVGLARLQEVKERELALRRADMRARHQRERDDLLAVHRMRLAQVATSGQSLSAVQAQNRAEYAAFEKRTLAELQAFDRSALAEMDAKVAEQQTVMQQLGVPGFFLTQRREDVELQAAILRHIVQAGAKAAQSPVSTMPTPQPPAMMAPPPAPAPAAPTASALLASLLGAGGPQPVQPPPAPAPAPQPPNPSLASLLAAAAAFPQPQPQPQPAFAELLGMMLNTTSQPQTAPPPPPAPTAGLQQLFAQPPQAPPQPTLDTLAMALGLLPGQQQQQQQLPPVPTMVQPQPQQQPQHTTELQLLQQLLGTLNPHPPHF